MPVHEFWLRTGIPASHMATVAEAYRTLMAAECEDHALVDDDSIAEVLTPTPESSHLVAYTPGPAWGPTHTRGGVTLCCACISLRVVLFL